MTLASNITILTITFINSTVSKLSSPAIYISEAIEIYRATAKMEVQTLSSKDGHMLVSLPHKHVIESYQLKFRYSEYGPQMDFLSNVNGGPRGTTEDKKASTLLIRKLFLLMQNLEALPTAVHLTMKLYYYDDVTPPEYEPPGFKAGVNENLWFEGCAVHFRVGELQSSFHTMKLRVTAAQNRLGKLLEGGQLSENDTEAETPSLSQIRAAETVTRDCGQDLPSEDESLAQFKQPKKARAKRKPVRSKLPRMKKKKCF